MAGRLKAGGIRTRREALTMKYLLTRNDYPDTPIFSALKLDLSKYPEK